MSGTSAGGKKAAIINKNRYGDDYYSRLGKVGGKKGRGKSYGGGFAYVAPGQSENNGKEKPLNLRGFSCFYIKLRANSRDLAAFSSSIKIVP